VLRHIVKNCLKTLEKIKNSNRFQINKITIELTVRTEAFTGFLPLTVQ
jgi:hypothetical protein